VTGWSCTTESTFVPRQYIAVLPIMADPAARRNSWWTQEPSSPISIAYQLGNVRLGSIATSCRAEVTGASRPEAAIARISVIFLLPDVRLNGSTLFVQSETLAICSIPRLVETNVALWACVPDLPIRCPLPCQFVVLSYRHRPTLLQHVAGIRPLRCSGTGAYAL
jgi:hypothetical protein